jgi:hypothetical protein
MCNLKCTIIPIIIGAIGIVTRSLKKNLEGVPGKHSIDSLQKTAVLGTSHIKRKVLQSEA